MTLQSTSTQDVERIVTTIRDIFAVFDDPPEEDVSRLHREFFNAVTSANARLKECDELLRRGLRQEAIQECEEEPQLLDLVAQLDIPEWQSWAEYVVQFGIPPQPALLIDVAAELNEAYATAQSLEGLLQRHRLLALARSPLADRLALLRTIADRDPKNPAWRADLQIYEAVRHKELRNEIDALATQGNLRGLASLNRELKDSRWIVAPPTALLEEARNAHQRLLAIDSRSRLTQLEPVINAAFGAFELDEIARARDQWNAAWAHAGLPGEHDLAQRVRAAFSWHDEEKATEHLRQQHERELGELEAALDDDRATLNDLERLRASLARYDEPILPRLQRRYEERIRALQLSQTRRGRLRLVSIVGAILVCGALVAMLMVRQHRQSEIAAAAEALNRMLADHRPSDARAYYDDLAKSSPRVAESPQLLAVAADVEAQFKSERDRQERLAVMIRELEAIEPDASWDALAAAQRLLDKAKKIAVGEADLVPLLTIERKLTDVTIALQSATDAQFQKDVLAFREKGNVGSAASESNLSQMLREATELAGRPHVSRATLAGSGIDIIVSQLKTNLEDAERRREEEVALRQLVAAVGDSQRYQEALNEYINANPNAVRASDFRSVLDSLDILESQAKWNGLADQWNSHSLTAPADADALITVIESLAKEFAGFPMATDAASLKEYVTSVKARIKDDGSDLLAGLRDVLKDDIFNMRRVKQVRTGNYHYFFGEITPARNGGVLTLVALKDSRDPNITDPRQFKPDDLLRAEDSPQKAFAAKANKALTDPNASYEFAVCAALHYLDSDPSMDPMLKCRLMTIFYDRAAPGSSILESELRRFRAQIEPPYALEDQNFLATDDPQVTKVRANVSELLGRVPDADRPRAAYVNRIAPRVTAITERAVQLPKLTWVGILMQGENKHWNVLGTPPASSQSSQLAIIRRDTSQALSYMTIGDLSSTGQHIDEENSELFRDGQPVFAVTTPQ